MAEMLCPPLTKSCFSVRFAPLSFSLTQKAGKQKGICMCSVQDELRARLQPSSTQLSSQAGPCCATFHFLRGARISI